MKTIELIDKYEVHQSKEGDYNPPSYIWVDNTGELIRCKDCKHQKEVSMFTCDKKWSVKYCGLHLNDDTNCYADDECYCSWAERK